MEYRHSQVRQELTSLNKALSDLGASLSSAAKDVASPGVIPRIS